MFQHKTCPHATLSLYAVVDCLVHVPPPHTHTHTYLLGRLEENDHILLFGGLRKCRIRQGHRVAVQSVGCAGFGGFGGRIGQCGDSGGAEQQNAERELCWQVEVGHRATLAGLELLKRGRVRYLVV